MLRRLPALAACAAALLPPSRHEVEETIAALEARGIARAKIEALADALRASVGEVAWELLSAIERSDEIKRQRGEAVDPQPLHIEGPKPLSSGYVIEEVEWEGDNAIGIKAVAPGGLSSRTLPEVRIVPSEPKTPRERAADQKDRKKSRRAQKKRRGW